MDVANLEFVQEEESLPVNFTSSFSEKVKPFSKNKIDLKTFGLAVFGTISVVLGMFSFVFTMAVPIWFVILGKWNFLLLGIILTFLPMGILLLKGPLSFYREHPQKNLNIATFCVVMILYGLIFQYIALGFTTKTTLIPVVLAVFFLALNPFEDLAKVYLKNYDCMKIPTIVVIWKFLFLILSLLLIMPGVIVYGSH